jgi:hypothetical protein
MNRQTPMTKEDDTRETPPDLFAELDARFHFDLDACATHANALCPMYFTEDGQWHQPVLDGIWRRGAGAVKLAHENGLTGSWKGRRVFVNPPFTMIPEFLNKSWFSEAGLVYCIIPATRTEQPWWHEYVEPYRDGRDYAGPMTLRTEFMQGRKHFLIDGKPIMRKNKDGSLYIDPETGKPARSSPKFGMVGLLFTPKGKP